MTERERWLDVYKSFADAAKRIDDDVRLVLMAMAKRIAKDEVRISGLEAERDKLKRRETELADALKQCRTRRDQIMRGRAAIRREVLIEAAARFESCSEMEVVTESKLQSEAAMVFAGIGKELRRMAEEQSA